MHGVSVDTVALAVVVVVRRLFIFFTPYKLVIARVCTKLCVDAYPFAGGTVVHFSNVKK